MQPLDQDPERYSPHGDMRSGGILRQIGRPSLDPLAVLVRESAQNSWDARIKNGSPVRFEISGWRLSGEQQEFARSTVFRETLGNAKLREVLHEEQGLYALAIADRGTTGLGGPVRADRAVPDHGSMDFVNLLRNIGEGDYTGGGGTYGYGKAILFLLSRVKTICAHTHCVVDGEIQPRFIGVALGGDFEEEGRRYTGRHWWGRRCSGDDIVDPVRDKEADELAAALGMPEIGRDQTGTTILILAPDFGERSPRQAMNCIKLSILWYLWPKMLERAEDGPEIRFRLSLDEEELEIPDPTQFPPIGGFVKAMEQLRRFRQDPDPVDGDLRRVEYAEMYRPRRRLGIVSIVGGPHKSRRHLDTGVEDHEFAPPISEHSHHIALMRNVELVVRYYPGPEYPTDLLEYAGVFIPDPDVDESFAEAEPPTHDDWRWESIQDSDLKSDVRVAFRRLDEKLKAFTQSDQTLNVATGARPLGQFAEELGGLIPAVEGTGPNVQPFNGRDGGEGGGGRTRRGRLRPSLDLVGAIELESREGRPLARVRFTLQHAEGSSSTRVRLDPRALILEGAREGDPPAGDEVPEVIEWIGPCGEQLATSGNVLLVSADIEGEFIVLVSYPGDARFAVGVEARRSDE